MGDKTPAHLQLEVMAEWEHYEALLDSCVSYHFNQLANAAIASYQQAAEIERLQAERDAYRQALDTVHPVTVRTVPCSTKPPWYEAGLTQVLSGDWSLIQAVRGGYAAEAAKEK